MTHPVQKIKYPYQFHSYLFIFSIRMLINAAAVCPPIQVHGPEGVRSGAVGSILDQHGRRPPAVSVHDPDAAGDQHLCRH